MDLVYKMVTDVNQFTKGMQAAQREAKKTERDLDDLIRKMEVQQKTMGQTGRQTELAGLESRGAAGGGTSGKFGYAQELAGQLDAAEKAATEKARADVEAAQAAAKHEAAMQRQVEAGSRLLNSLKLETVGLELGAVAARLYEVQLSNLSETDKMLATAMIESNAAIREKAAADRAAAQAADQDKAAIDRQVEAGLRLLASLEQERVALTEGAAAAKIFEVELSNLTAVDKAAAIELIKLNSATRDKSEKDKEAAQAAQQVETAMQRQVDAGFKLLSSLEQDKIALLEGADAAKIFAIELSDLTLADKELAIALVKETAATKAKRDADADAILKTNEATQADDRRREAALRMVQGLTSERIALKEGATAAAIYNVENSDLTRTQKDAAIALIERNALLRQEIQTEKDATAAMDRMGDAADQATAGLRQQAIALIGGATAGRIYAIQSSDMTEFDKKRLITMTLVNAELQKQHGGMSAAAGKNLFAIQALAFGVQDFAQVVGNTGLAGGLSAAANNLIFMTSILSPHLAIVTAVGVAVAQLAAVLVPLAFNTENATKRLEEQMKRQREQIDLTLEQAKATADFNQQLRDADEMGSGRSLAKTTSNNLESVEAEIAARKEAARKLGDEWAKAEDKVREAKRTESVGGAMAADAGFRTREGEAEARFYKEESEKELKEIQKLEADAARLRKEKQIADRNSTQRDNEKFAEESRKSQREKEKQENDQFNRERDQAAKDEVAQQKAYVEERRKLERERHLEGLDEVGQKKAKVLEALAAEQEMIARWEQQGRVSSVEAQGLRMSARGSAAGKLEEIDQKAAEDAAKNNATEVDKQRRELAKQNQKAPDNTAVETNSSEGFKRVFDALGLNNGGDDPQRQLIVLQKQGNGYMAKLVSLEEAARRQQPVITGKKG